MHRPALGHSHLAAREWFRKTIMAGGIEFHHDGAGNHGARLPSGRPGARTLLLGSHLDSVPHGGRFDGALGVLAAYEVLRTVRDAEVELALHLEAIDFTDEEGTLVGLLGSRALSGELGAEELADPRCGGAALDEALTRAGLTRDGVLAARREPQALAGFLELHIEQGPRLSEAGADVGIVSALVGIGSSEVTFRGQPDHAGTTPMTSRRDAGLGAADFIVAANDDVRASFPDWVVNFGRLDLTPGAYNIVPGSARLAVEFRAPEPARLRELESRLVELARASAQKHGLELDVRPGVGIEPAACDPSIREAFARAAEVLALKHTTLVSGAGHDTMALARVCPAGMIFIPSTGGSHSSREHARWQDCVNGANVLLHAALGLATD